MKAGQIISPREPKRTKRSKFMSERSDLMSHTSLEEVDYVGPEEQSEGNNDSMKLIEAINKVKRLKLDLSVPPLETILDAGLDVMEEIIKTLEEKGDSDENVMKGLKTQYKELQAEESRAHQEVRPRFDNADMTKDEDMRKIMFSACDYFQQNRLRLNETAFLNGNKAIMLLNEDVIIERTWCSTKNVISNA